VTGNRIASWGTAASWAECADKTTVRNNEKRITNRDGALSRRAVSVSIRFSSFVCRFLSSTVGDRPPRDASAGNATPWRFHAHLAPPLASRAGETHFLKRAIASDANHCGAGNASGGVRSAWPVRRTHSPTVGDRPPRDAFPASSSWLAEGSVSHRREMRCESAKCEAEPFSRRELVRSDRSCLTVILYGADDGAPRPVYVNFWIRFPSYVSPINKSPFEFTANTCAP
jgi:hypothetical protein